MRRRHEPEHLAPTQPADQATPPADAKTEHQTTPGTQADPNRTLAYAAAGAAPPLPQIPGFEIEAELGRGGMGVVYRARQLGLDRTVALKMILKADFASPEQKLRFQIEAENAARVQHPNIVQVFEIGAHQGQPYFALEFVEGGSLADWLTSHRPAPAAAAALIETLARAVHAAHLQGIVHRDLKPANILLGKAGGGVVRLRGGEEASLHYPTTSPPRDLLFPKIADFGLAKRLDSTHDLTGSGAVMGTPSHMAPEQATGDAKHVGPAADQYALGVILYQLLTNRLPFEAAGLPALLRQIAEAEPTAPRQRNPAVPVELEAICLKALAKAPGQRYASAEAFAEDLKNWREHRPIAARAATRTEQLVKWCRRYPAVAALIVVSVLAALSASGLAWWAVGAERAAAASEASAKQNAKLAGDRLVQVEAEKKRVEEEKQVATAVRDFLQNKLLAQGDPREQADRLLLLGRGDEEREPDPRLSVLLASAAAELAPEKIEASFPKQPLLQAALLDTVGDTYRSIGGKDNDRYELAISVLKRAAQLKRDHLGSDHLDTLTSMNNLAGVYTDAGLHDLAQSLNEATLKAKKASLGADHPSTLTSMNNLALSYKAAGRFELAVPLLEETLKLTKAKLGANHPDTLNSMSNLAAGHVSAGKLDQALSLHEETLRLRKAIQGVVHPDTLQSMNNLACHYHEAGKPSLALTLFEETLKLMEARLGADHPHTLTCMSNFASVCRDAGKHDLAQQLTKRTCDLRKAKLGADHPATLLSMNNLAVSYRDVGKLDLALPLLEEVLKLRKGKLGADHADTLASAGNLASVYQEAGKLDLALPLYEETLTHRRAKLGADHPDTLNSMNNLALAYDAAGKLDRALPLLEETLKLRQAKLGAGHPDTLNSMNNLATTYEDAGRLDRALPLLEETLKLRKATQRADHPDLLTSMANLGVAYSHANQGEKAAPLLKEFIAAKRAELSERHPDFAELLAKGALYLLKCGQFAAAEEMLRECLALWQAKQPDDWRTFNTQSLLGAALRGQNKLAEAEPLLVKGYEGLKQRAATMPPLARPRLLDAGERLAEACEATHRSAEAAKVRAELLPLRVPPKPPGR